MKQRQGWKEGEVTKPQVETFLGPMFIILTTVLVSWVYIQYVKIYQMGYVTYVFIVSQLYLNKALKNPLDLIYNDGAGVTENINVRHITTGILLYFDYYCIPIV